MLVAAAEQLMQEEGYVAVSARRVAARAGLKPQLVHYYFRTMDELLLDVFDRFAARFLDRQAQALATPRPLTALWELYMDDSVAVIVIEFFALANHRPAVRDKIAGATEQFRIGQIAELERAMRRVGIDVAAYPASAIVMLMMTISTTLKMESNLDIAHGHAELLALIEGRIEEVEASAGAAAN